MNNVAFKENEDTEWGWFIPIDINITNEKEEKINSINNKKNIKINNLIPINENTELCENITTNFNSITRFSIKKNPSVKLIPYFNNNINLINYNTKNIINRNNLNNNIIINKNHKHKNILNCILIINCSNMKRMFIGCLYYTSVYIGCVYNYVTSLFVSKKIDI